MFNAKFIDINHLHARQFLLVALGSALLIMFAVPWMVGLQVDYMSFIGIFYAALSMIMPLIIAYR
jgi:hypothetical protein